MDTKQLTLEMIQHMTSQAIEKLVEPETKTLVLVTPEVKERLLEAIMRTTDETLRTCIFDIDPEDLTIGTTISISCCNRPYDICTHYCLIPNTEITLASENRLKEIVYNIENDNFNPMGGDKTLLNNILEMKKQIDLLKANGQDEKDIINCIMNESDLAVSYNSYIPCSIEPSKDGSENSFDIIL